MKKQKKLIFSTLVLTAIVLASVVFIQKNEIKNYSEKLVSVGETTIYKEDMLWKLQRKDYSNLIKEELKKEVYLSNVEIDEEIKKRVEKNMLFDAGVDNKEDILLKENITMEELDRNIEAKTAIVQHLMKNANISKEEIDEEISKQATFSSFNLYVANKKEEKAIDRRLKTGLNLENAVQKANEEYYVSYKWNVSLAEVIAEYGLQEKQTNLLIELKEKDSEKYEIADGALFVELSQKNNLNTEQLYINSIYKLASDRGFTEESIFEVLKETTEIVYFDEKYFE